jgi:hypothetical protein
MRKFIAVVLVGTSLPWFPLRVEAQVTPNLVMEGVRICASAPVACAVVVTAGGIIMWEYISPSGPVLVPIPPRLRRQIQQNMLPKVGERGSTVAPRRRQRIDRRTNETQIRDPEREEWVTDEEYILADSPDEAQRKCRQLARERGLELQEIKQPSKKGGKRYTCKFGGYVER